MRYGDESYDVPCITGKGVEDPVAMARDAHTVKDWINNYIDENDVPASIAIKSNLHDFGSYPSIEVYYHLDACKAKEEDVCTDEGCLKCAAHEAGLDKIRAMELAYAKQFEEYL